MKLFRLIAINILVLLILAGISASGIELWVRMQPRNVFVEFDPILGLRLQPGAEGIYRGLFFLAPNPYINTPVRINSYGIRGPEITIEKPPGSHRVLVLGDSFVQAFEVDNKDTFSALLEKKAREESSSLVEFIPMGVMGYGTAQELLWLRANVAKFKPDLVILMVFLYNDVMENSRSLHYSGARPYFELEGDSLTLVALPTKLNRFKYWAAEHMRSYYLYKEIGYRSGPIRRVLNLLGLDSNPLGEKQSSKIVGLNHSRGFKLTFALIEEMRRVAADAGSPLVIAYHGTYPTGLERDSESLLAAFCDENKFECVNLNGDLRASKENFIPQDDHWSVAGHKLVAEILWKRWSRHFLGPTR